MSQKYVLTVEERPAYLYFHVQAEVIDLEIAILYIDEMMMHLNALGGDRVLFVRDTPTPVSETYYETVGRIVADLLPRDIKFALVDKSPSRDLIKRGAEDAAARTGIHLRTFFSEEEAEAWLIAGEAAENRFADTHGEGDDSLAA